MEKNNKSQNHKENEKNKKTKQNKTNKRKETHTKQNKTKDKTEVIGLVEDKIFCFKFITWSHVTTCSAGHAVFWVGASHAMSVFVESA